MIFRLSEKLNTKIKAGNLPALPLHENPLFMVRMMLSGLQGGDSIWQ